MRISVKKSRLMAIEKVVSNEELLTAILVRLPPRSIFKFKCVSKRWNNILRDPYFHHCYRIRTRNEQLCGGDGDVGRHVAFIQNKDSYARVLCPVPDHLMNILSVAQIKGYKFKQVPCEFGVFEHGTDGLILCTENNVKYFVVNPLNRTWDELPQSSNLGILDNLGLVCEENSDILVPSFRVVGITKNSDTLEESNTMFIETYSSRTGKWKPSKLLCTEEFSLRYKYGPPMVCNGVFHWHLSSKNALVVYDSNVEDEKYVQLIKLPLNQHFGYALTRSLRGNVLWVGMILRECVMFWMLPRDENGNYKQKTTISTDEWILKYTVEIWSLTKEMLMVVESKKRKKKIVCDEMIAKEELFLSFVELIPSNPLVAVFSLKQKIFLYNLETNSIEFVKYRGRPFSYRSSTEWHMFRESIYLSTYAPLARSY